MKRSNYKRIIKIFLLATGCIAALPVHSAVIRINFAPRPFLWLTIGSFGPGIDEVSFNIPSGQLGNGNAINGNPRIRILAACRAVPRFSRTAVLSVDSSIPLTNGTATAPFTDISWQSQNGHIPSGRYDGSNNQALLSFPNSHLIVDFHRFRYDNTSVLEAGTYTGRVIYTLSMP